ncbi:uncharacterized protein C21orf58 homolog [Apteryx mantelli]|uniref:Uncharacterized protein C21orf58 homolog n=1 Tax=Apteryx mantelli TaxID=2696672 RepID=A0A8B7J939_9AVES|nr:PREDICTED: uncharacterized protein C21orf58 homolog [Apteryx mantelli mantelli]
MTEPSVVDHMTRLKLKLLEKRLENERENLERMDSPPPTARNRHEDMLQNALRRRKDLLQELREHHLLEELSQPPVPAGGYCKNYRADPQHLIYQLPFPAPRVEPPRIIQQTMPPQPATIIQQLPQQPPLITQIPPAQPFAAPHSGSIKEDMVEMMLMQNAQMHQIIMQNMMLKALPPMAFAQPAGPSSLLFQHAQQDPQLPAPVVVKAERPRPSTVHHHHHYSPPGVLPPIGYSVWPPAVQSGLMGQNGAFPSMVHHLPGSTLPVVHTWPEY